ncbi:MAG TPA: ATP-binding protein [Candidatus Limnocylindrales bacterium]|nr:ATP-binding protein [Candidatus Limnocylindrales bacterium]
MVSIDLAYSALVEGKSQRTPGAHDAPLFELRRCPTARELQDPAADTEWSYFQDRFRRSLANRLSLSPKLARGIAAALGEMVDNVVQHAGLGDTPKALVAYEVNTQSFSMSVADTGRGILSSLRENPTNRTVTSDSAALTAAVLLGASRRTDAPGSGFLELRQALADLQGLFCFRTGSARLQLDGRGSGERVETISNSPELVGFQMSVTATPGFTHSPPL